MSPASVRVSPLWRLPAPALTAGIEKTLAASGLGARVFFRADDIGVPSRHFSRLLEVFGRHGVPLNLAVVPSWLTQRRWEIIEAQARPHARLWCWHQHGRRHANHQKNGKKAEFGPDRSTGAARRDLVLGRERLAAILGPHFTPVFTPPWNRCSKHTLACLDDLGYAAVSRSAGAAPPPPAGLRDLFVNVDLHTRKEPDPREAAARLLQELAQALRSGWCGVMIHHQRMNGAAFTFLDSLLSRLKKNPAFELLKFTDMIG